MADTSAPECSTLPPVTIKNYTPKGTFQDTCGLNSYIISTLSPTRGLLIVYDVFGHSPQLLQGADRLSAALNATIVVPGFFGTAVAQESWFPPDTPEKQAAQAAFRASQFVDAHFVNLGKIAAWAKEREEWSGVKKWGVLGLCWGGKIATTFAIDPKTSTVFKATGQVHPGKLEVSDAKALDTTGVPHICLASNGEPEDIVAEYAKILVGEGKPSVVETYKTSHHGWMGARAKLEEESGLKEYERGYDQLAAFYAKHL